MVQAADNEESSLDFDGGPWPRSEATCKNHKLPKVRLVCKEVSFEVAAEYWLQFTCASAGHFRVHHEQYNAECFERDLVVEG